MFGVTPPISRHFAVFRVALGGYLVFHFVSLVPYAAELFGETGMLPDAAKLVTYLGWLPFSVGADSPRRRSAADRPRRWSA